MLNRFEQKPTKPIAFDRVDFSNYGNQKKKKAFVAYLCSEEHIKNDKDLTFNCPSPIFHSSALGFRCVTRKILLP